MKFLEFYIFVNYFVEICLSVYITPFMLQYLKIEIMESDIMNYNMLFEFLLCLVAVSMIGSLDMEYEL